MKKNHQFGGILFLTTAFFSAATLADQSMALYKNAPLKNGQLFIQSYGQQQAFTGASTASNSGDIKLQVSSKKKDAAALTLNWKDTWSAGLTLKVNAPLNLGSIMSTGVLALDVKVNELNKGGISFRMECNSENCNRVVPFTLAARELRGKDWSKVYVPLNCFKYANENYSSTTVPFGFDLGGAGEVSFANVELLPKAPKTAHLLECPNYNTASITPSMLNEWWSIDWWLPRHEQKRAEAKAIAEKGGKIDLLFIGDSITQGWEKEGESVWKKYYADKNAFAIGFSGDRTENVLWRLQHGAVENMSPKLVVMMIGTNNTGHRQEMPSNTALGIKTLINELQQRIPGAKILLLAIFPRDENSEGSLRKINNQVNEIIKGYADNKRVFFADINSSFLTNDGILSKEIMPDLLHPNEKGYNLWAENLNPVMTKLME